MATLRVALEHQTTYRFDRVVAIGPHVLRLRPAPHTVAPVQSYAVHVRPEQHRLSWQTDPFGNHLARVVFAEPADELTFTVELVADLAPVNPFDFFVEPYAARSGFAYPEELAADLAPCLTPVADPPGPRLAAWLAQLPPPGGMPTVQFLVDLNAAVRAQVGYSERLEAGVQPPEVTLERRVGSCRDSAWLLVAALRHCGLAARFVSGYLVQLTADADTTDLHAWAETYLPGAGWIGLDATSGLMTAESHLPLAATSHPASAAPVTGATAPCRVEFSFANRVARLPA